MLATNRIDLGRFFIFVLLVVVFAFLQGEDIIFFKVKPNLVLAALVAFSFLIPDFISYLLLVLIGITVLKFQPGFSLDTLFLGIITTLHWFLMKFMSGRESVNLLIAVTMVTLVFYLVLQPSFIYQQPIILITEIFYNIAVAFFLRYFFKDESRT